jgi:phosphate starvation-inducible PhoH-like protein
LVRSSKKKSKPGTEPKGLLLNEIKPRTINQSSYLDSINENIITVCTGPAGSGKSFMAVGRACHMLANGQIDKIVICRSIVGCGREIGILPGDVEDKIHAYMLPVLEYLDYFIGPNMAIQLIREGTIKLLPVELIRGHTYDKSFIILEECQNIDIPQLKLFMSRIGKDSKMVLIGDNKQTDIGKYSCMPFLLQRFNDINGLGMSALTYDDVLRHPIIPHILEVFDKNGF